MSESKTSRSADGAKASGGRARARTAGTLGHATAADGHTPQAAARASAALDGFVLTEIVSHLLRRAHFRAEEIFSEELGASGLTPRQKALLITAYQHPGANQNELAERIAIDRNSFAEMLSRMVSRGYVTRTRSKEDARAYEITITDKGIQAVEEVLPGDALVEQRIMEPLPPELRPLFVKCLKIMVGLEK